MQFRQPIGLEGKEKNAMSKKFGLLLAILMVATAILTACQSQGAVETVEVVQTVEVPKEVVQTVEVTKQVVQTVEVPKEVQKGATLAILHFSVIQGTTWSGAQDRAGKRIAEKYPDV